MIHPQNGLFIGFRTRHEMNFMANSQSLLK
jgi:hypothetical protein